MHNTREGVTFWCWKHLAGVESTSLADFIGDLTRANWESLTGAGVRGVERNLPGNS